MDLRRDPPRSPYCELDGIPWLPRLIDKTRAMYGGTLGDYLAFPCPSDRLFLWCIGLKSGPLGDLVGNGADDQAVLAYVRNRARRLESGGQRFRRWFLEVPSNALWRAVVRRMTPQTRARVMANNPTVNPLVLSCVGALLALEEGHPIDVDRVLGKVP